MTKPDYRAMCAELLADYEQCRYRSELHDRARALLDQPVAEGPTDDEIEEWADACPEAPLEEMDPEVHGWRRCFTAKEFSETIRAALDRWGHSTPQPVADGEVAELVAWLRESLDSALQSGNSKSIKNHCRLLDVLGRPTPQPVAVSERLPGPEDCDEQGRCWLFGYVEGDWRLISATNSGIPKLKYCFSHWLPANALPTPEATND